MRVEVECFTFRCTNSAIAPHPSTIIATIDSCNVCKPVSYIPIIRKTNIFSVCCDGKKGWIGARTSDNRWFRERVRSQCGRLGGVWSNGQEIHNARQEQ